MKIYEEMEPECKNLKVKLRRTLPPEPFPFDVNDFDVNFMPTSSKLSKHLLLMPCN